eukprot:2017791-Pyramimonas_sp.AAC.2
MSHLAADLVSHIHVTIQPPNRHHLMDEARYGSSDDSQPSKPDAKRVGYTYVHIPSCGYAASVGYRGSIPSYGYVDRLRTWR